MPVYVNRIFSNRTESGKKNVFIIVSEKNANAEDESQGAFTLMGPEYPKIFILCQPEPGFHVVPTNRQGLFLCRNVRVWYEEAQRFLQLRGKLECIRIPKLSLKRNKSGSRYLFVFFWQQLPKSGPEHKYTCLHPHHLTINPPPRDRNNLQAQTTSSYMEAIYGGTKQRRNRLLAKLTRLFILLATLAIFWNLSVPLPHG